jgi:hypothetical protein
MSARDGKPSGDWSNIAPDVNCPHCGMVIVCPHTPAVPYPPYCINPRPTSPDIEWTDNFPENVRRLERIADGGVG